MCPTHDQLKAAILEEARVPRHPGVFQIGFGAKQVTVYAQQARALRLVWALHQSGELASVVIVGGGISGVTAAAAAMLLGATVTLLEQNDELLHLQRGCHTRYLHPRIFDWPQSEARRASAGLPIMEWSVGTAAEVATTLLGELRRIAKLVGQNNFERTSVRDIDIAVEGGPITWNHRGEQCVAERPSAIILAIGFGIEKSVEQLPRRSYWRVDSLTQTGIDSLDLPYRVLVAGTGDGGIFDVLRAKLKEFDHGGFMDECVLRLESAGANVASDVATIESDFAREHAQELERLQLQPHDKDDLERRFAAWFDLRYEKLVSRLAVLDDLFRLVRCDTHVFWCGNPPAPCSYNAQPLNRLLGWYAYRRCRDLEPTKRLREGIEYMRGGVSRVRLLLQAPTEGARYQVNLSTPVPPVDVHQVVIRYGVDSALKRSFPSVYAALDERRMVAPNVTKLEPVVDDVFRRAAATKWHPPHERVNAMKLFGDPERPTIDKRTKKTVWRIRLWLASAELANVLWVDYELHSEYGAVRRRATYVENAQGGEHFRTWVNTYDDYWIRVRCSDGFEVGWWLSDALPDGDCKTDLMKEAQTLRHADYKARNWCDHVDLKLDGRT